MAKVLLTWNEPHAFVLRLRSWSGWLWRLAIAVGIAGVVLLLLQLLGGPRNLAMQLQVSMLAGLLLTILPDLPFLQRTVRITEDAIDWEADGVKLSFSGSYPLANIGNVELLRPGEWRYKFGGMKLHQVDGQWFLFAVPRGKRLETIATILTRLEVPVTLSDWEATTADTRTRVAEELSLANLPPSTRDAVFTPMPSEEPKLLSPGIRIVAAFVAGGPTLLTLLAMIGTWIYLGIYWSELTWLDRGLITAGGIGVFVVGFLYVLFIGQFIEKAILVRAGFKALRARSSPLVDAADEEVFPVSLYNRESWTKVIAKQADFGFLQVNRRKRALVFEGDKERWVIPITALTAVRIEEAEVGKEGAAGPEIRYYVVLGTYRDDEIWEVGLILARTKWGNDNAKARHERMGMLFDELATAITVCN